MIALGIISAQGRGDPPIDPNRIVNINFSATGVSDSATGWNSVKFPLGEGFNPSGIAFNNLLDDQGVASGINLVFQSIQGSIGTSEISISQNFPIPELYRVDLYGYGSPGPTATFRITGLNMSLLYDLRFSNEIVGSTDSRITINGVSVNPSYVYPTTTSFDDSAYMAFNNIVPSSGGYIEFTVDSYGQSYWALLGMRIRQKSAEPSPSFRFVQNSDNPSPYGFAESLPAGYASAPSASLPLIVFMHGDGERGDGNMPDLEKLLAWGIPKFAENGTWIAKNDFVMLAPQSATNGYDLANLHSFLGWAVENYKVDPDSVYCVGISMGAWDSMSYIGVYGQDSLFKKMVPLSGLLPNYAGGTFSVAAASQVPCWILTNDGDPSVPFYSPGTYGGVLQTRDSINAINPGQIIVTAFDRDDHQSLWGPVTQGEWEGTEMAEYAPYNQTIYDWLSA